MEGRGWGAETLSELVGQSADDKEGVVALRESASRSGRGGESRGQGHHQKVDDLDRHFGGRDPGDLAPHDHRYRNVGGPALGWEYSLNWCCAPGLQCGLVCADALGRELISYCN
jgi:hypothetical protein